MPVEIVKNVPLLEVEIAGRGPFTMLLDTGVTPSAIDLDAARGLGLRLPEEPSGEASGAGEDAAVPVFAVTLPGVWIAGSACGDLDAVAMDLRAIGAALGRPLHGILGHGFLAGRIVTIDYPAAELRLHDEPPALPDAAEAWRLPLVLREGDIMPLVPIRVDGVSIRATLDTGSSQGLTLFPPGTRALGLEESARAGAERSVVGARGRAVTRTGRVGEIRLGPFDIGERSVTFAGRGAGDATRDGNLGGALLSGLAVVLDYRGGTITFLRR